MGASSKLTWRLSEVGKHHDSLALTQPGPYLQDSCCLWRCLRTWLPLSLSSNRTLLLIAWGQWDNCFQEFLDFLPHDCLWWELCWHTHVCILGCGSLGTSAVRVPYGSTRNQLDIGGWLWGFCYICCQVKVVLVSSGLKIS